MSLLLISICAVAAFPSAPLTYFSGTWTSSSPKITRISVDPTDGSCDTYSSTPYYYSLVNFTFPSAGVRTINAYGIDFIAVASDSFDVSNLCTGRTVFPLIQGYDELDELYTWGHWFNANVSYTLIVSAVSSGPYVGEIWDGIQGQISNVTVKNQSWTPLLTSSNTGVCTATSTYAYPSLYDVQTVSTTAGWYNVFLAFAQNTAIVNSSAQLPSEYPTLTVFKGNLSGTDLSTITCASGNFVTSAEGSYKTLNAQLFTIWLSGNQTYSFAVSAGDLSYYGYYSLTIAPAYRIKFKSSLVNFQPPTRGTCAATSSCTTNTGFARSPYGTAFFSVAPNSPFYIYATENQDASGNSATRDLEFNLYNGDNTLLLPCGGPTSKCVATQDSMTGIILNSVGSSFTLVAQGYYDKSSSSNSYGTNASFDLYIVGGVINGNKTGNLAGVNSGAMLSPCLALFALIGFAWM